MFKKYILSFTLFLSFFISQASHYMGGEITWDCLSNGRYKFTLKLYRECGGNSINFSSTETINVYNHPSVSSISMTRIAQNDISPNCYSPTLEITCAGYENGGAANGGAVEEHVYTSTASYPNGVLLQGTPPAGGWIFTHESCCRNPCTNIAGTSSKDWTLRAVMYPYLGWNAYPCYDNSPAFVEKPSTVICTGYPFTYNHNASDKELDSLVYSWATPLEGSINSPMTGYQAGYSYSSPLPGTMQDPNNQPGVVNPHTGEISFTSYTQGAFVTVVKVASYKCGMLVAEVFREMQVVLLACGSNNPPDVSAPFVDPITGTYVVYSDTVYAGELVTFPLSATDFESNPNGNPQMLYLTASGSQFGTNYTNASAGCLNPPCAILSPAPITQTTGPSPSIAGQFGVSTNFNWQTTCDHLASNAGCNRNTNIYNFVIKVQDDFCPAPAIKVTTITVVVKATPTLKAPDLRCLAVQPNGSVVLNWIAPVDSFNSFSSYIIYSSLSPTGPFTIVDSVTTYSQTTYTDVNASGNSQSIYYFIRTRSGCGHLPQHLSISGDTLSTIFLQVYNQGNTAVDLEWNPLHNPNLITSSGWYRIYKEYPLGTWTLLDSTQSLSYISTAIHFCEDFNYKIEMNDQLGCISISNIENVLFNSQLVSPQLTCTTVDTLGNVIINWKPIIDTTASFVCYKLFSCNNLNGPFTFVDSVNSITQTTISHYGAGANLHPVYYYITTGFSCNHQGIFYAPNSDTISTIFLTVTNVANTTASLTWNATHTPPLPSSSIWYKIFREYPDGQWSLVDSSQTLSYSTSSIYFCEEFNYRIVLDDTSGCFSSSNVDGELFVNTLGSPELKCASVDTAGHITISWVPLNDDATNLFDAYLIYASISPNGPFTLVDSATNVIQTTATISTYNGNTQPVYFYIKTRSYCFVPVISAPSDTIRSIHLTATNSGNGLANLSWNSLRNPNLNTSFGFYKIYREFPVGIWTYVISTSNTNYIDTVFVCSNTLKYRVEISDSTGCTSVSSIDGDLFEDAIAPVTPIIDTVTVDWNSQQAHITWDISPNFDTKGYNVYKHTSINSAGTMLYPPILGRFNNSFLYTNSNANLHSEFFSVAAFDSCQNTSAMSVIHQTIFLSAAMNQCLRQIVLNWNTYKNLNPMVGIYKVFVSVNNGPFALLGFKPANDSTYTHTGIVQGNIYRYFVEAIDVDNIKTSSSNRVAVDAKLPRQPRYAYIKYVTVLNDNEIELSCFVDKEASIKEFQIQRSDSIVGVYNLQASLPPNQTSLIKYTDNTVAANLQSYSYKVVVIDSCGSEALVSNTATTMYLQVEPNYDMTNGLNWNAYSEWLGSVEGYKIYREIDGTMSLYPIIELPAGTTAYIDDISNLYTGEGKFCYYVEATEGLGNHYAFKDSSSSNKACALQFPKIFVPNAFVPKGENKIFKPISIFIDKTDYYFNIYDRWGQMIFETTDVEKGWDGRIGNFYVASGVYVYFVKFKNAKGETIEKHGTVTLLD